MNPSLLLATMFLQIHRQYQVRRLLLLRLVVAAVRLLLGSTGLSIQNRQFQHLQSHPHVIGILIQKHMFRIHHLHALGHARVHHLPPLVLEVGLEYKHKRERGLEQLEMPIRLQWL